MRDFYIFTIIMYTKKPAKNRHRLFLNSKNIMQKYKKFLDFQAEKGRKHKIIAKNLEVIEKHLIFAPSECMF